MTESNVKIPLLVVVGPTAVGKTAAVVAGADGFPVEVISADSRQIYKGMEIGTGAPSPDELQQAPHHFISVVPPDVRLSAGEFARKANLTIDDIIKRGKIPVVVGGSGLYVRALIDGLSKIPQPSADLRQRVQDEITERGIEQMTAELKRIDPEYVAKIKTVDIKRLSRALEVWRMTGRTLSVWHSEQDKDSRYDPVFVGLSRPREEIWRLIEKRVRAMVKAGWIEEVVALKEAYGGFSSLPKSVTEGLGYREIIRVIDEEYTVEEAIDKIVISTRQFAKRQMTWFRADKRIQWLESSGAEALSIWEEWLNRGINTLHNRYINQIWSSDAIKR